MRPLDGLAFSGSALRGYPVRTLLMLLAMSIGVAAVIILSSVGEGARRYVADQFMALGTDLLIVLPGKTETTGGRPPLLGATPRDLTIDDALSLYRSPAIEGVAPLSLGAAVINWRGTQREVTILGSTAELKAVRNLTLSRGRFLELSDPHRGEPVCVLGSKARKELFGPRAALGEWLEIADRRFRVIGILDEKGHSLFADFGDTVIIPVASAQAIFDSPSLFRILVQARSRAEIPRAEAAIKRIIRERHDGEEDITVITQDAMLGAFDDVLQALTLAVTGIGAISLLVAGILIMNVMLIAVSQRRSEIGLLKAVGASGRQILALFLAESAMLSLLGAGIGVLLGMGANQAIGGLIPALPVTLPLWALLAAVITALSMGILFGIMPARRAARLDPVRALQGR